MSYQAYVQNEKSNEINKNFEIYPNHTRNFLNILSKTSSYCTLKISNTLGVLVYKEEVKYNKGDLNSGIDVSFLRPGVYNIEILNKNDNSIYVNKFIKQ